MYDRLAEEFVLCINVRRRMKKAWCVYVVGVPRIRTKSFGLNIFLNFKMLKSNFSYCAKRNRNLTFLSCSVYDVLVTRFTSLGLFWQNIIQLQV